MANLSLKQKTSAIRTRCNQIEQELKELGAGTDMEILNEDKIDALQQEESDLEEELSVLLYDFEMGHERD